MEEKVFENVIDDKKIKEDFGDLAISVLVNGKLIDINKDLKHLVVEFGYLFKISENNFTTMFKMTIPKKLFSKERVFYFGTQNGNLMLLNSSFNEEMFRKIQHDMFIMHHVDIEKENRNQYIMELY